MTYKLIAHSTSVRLFLSIYSNLSSVHMSLPPTSVLEFQEDTIKQLSSGILSQVERDV